MMKKWIPKKSTWSRWLCFFVNIMTSWKEEEWVTLTMNYQFRVHFSLLFYDCCLFPVAIHFLFIGGTIVVFGFVSFVSETFTSKHISQTFSSPHHLISHLQHQKSNVQIFSEVLDVQKCWHVLTLLGLLLMKGSIQDYFITEKMNMKDLVAVVTFLLLKWCWVETLYDKGLNSWWSFFFDDPF